MLCLKQALKNLNTNKYQHLESRVEEKLADLNQLQSLSFQNPDIDYIQQIQVAKQEYQDTFQLFQDQLFQKAKMQWLEDGDRGTRLFSDHPLGAAAVYCPLSDDVAEVFAWLRLSRLSWSWGCEESVNVASTLMKKNTKLSEKIYGIMNSHWFSCT